MFNVVLKKAAPATATMLIVLAGAREIYKFPKPLTLTLAVIFIVCSVIFWCLMRSSRRGLFLQVVGLLLFWAAAAASLLGFVYHHDRAGWNWFKLTGYNETLPEELSDRVDLPASVFVKHAPAFTIDPEDSSRLVLPKGSHDFDETVIVPRGLTLTIAPGTVVRMGVGSSFISYSPIFAQGTANEPILFTSQNKWCKWGVVGVVNADTSKFEYVRFEHGRQASVNGVNLPGTLSLIKTNAEISHCEFVDLFGKDCAYANSGRVNFRNNLFRNSFKDGVDFDGGGGEVSNNHFDHCGDEAIDLEESSQVAVFGNRVGGSKDAANFTGRAAGTKANDNE